MHITGTLNTIVTPEGIYSYRFDPTFGIYDAVITPLGLASEKQLIEDGFLRQDLLIKTPYDVLGVYSASPNKLGLISVDAVGGKATSPRIELFYNYKDDGSLQGISSSFHNMSITYDKDSGRLSGTRIVSGSSEIKDYYQYNSYGELATYVASYNNTFLYSLDLTYDDLGRVSSKIEAIGESFNQKFDYLYDTRGRLIEVRKNEKVVSKYNYDSNGNRISGNANAQPITAAYDAQDRLVTYNVNTFQHNLNGELLSKKNNVSNQITPVTFNSFSQLTSVKVGSVLTEYQYDGFGRRAQNLLNGKIQNRYIYKGQIQLAGILGSDGLVNQRFGYLSKSHSPDFMIMKNEAYRMITDHLGSVRLVVRLKDGSIVQEMMHDEFGKVVKNTNPGFQPVGVAGGLYEHNTNLVQFGARWYDPESGRWISKDPISFKGGDANLYAYVGGDPVNLIDPKGTDAYEYSDGIHTVLGIDDSESPTGITYVDFHPGDASTFSVLSFQNVKGQIDISSEYLGGKLSKKNHFKTNSLQDKLLLARARSLKKINEGGKYPYSLIPGQSSNNCKSFVSEVCEGVCK